MATLHAGVMGFVSKQDIPRELVNALRTVLQGRLYITPSLRDAYSRLVLEDAGKSEGRSTKEIAATLGISTKTVELHRASLAEVLGLRTVADLTRYALQHGIIPSKHGVKLIG